MQSRTMITGIMALVFGASSAVGVSQFRGSGKTDPGVEMVPVVVAVAEIPRGAMLTADSLRISQWPKGAVPDGAAAKIDDVVERTVLTPLTRGEPVLSGKIASKNSGRGLAALIPKGMRAFTIQTAHVASNVAGFILPNDRVDVLLTMSRLTRDDTTGGGSTTTLLQNIEVLAAHQHLHAPAENKTDPRQVRSVTLLVTPNQAARLDLAQNKGTLHLSLRNPEDDLEAETTPATMIGLRFLQEPPNGSPSEGELDESEDHEPMGQAKQPTRYRVRTLRGKNSTEVTLERFE